MLNCTSNCNTNDRVFSGSAPGAEDWDHYWGLYRRRLFHHLCADHRLPKQVCLLSSTDIVHLVIVMASQQPQRYNQSEICDEIFDICADCVRH